MPDLGLINQRYTMDLKGASQQLEIRTWGTVLRMAETIPYEWQPGEWYTMKMSVTLEDGNAIVHGNKCDFAKQVKPGVFDTVLELVVDGAHGQVALEIFKRLFDLHELDVVAP